ncbi:hypothetical protein EAI_03011 [Harpegnathos saltator]|uniref:Uncharacterized protein n=1 Tax=Harpegnathos saltator TaxID=610380 RepID=E2BAH5_HARSA|nr:hypothetical protein EAI_03011 [Harpegnathos saltator]
MYAIDILSRCLDYSDVNYVISTELPNDKFFGAYLKAGIMHGIVYQVRFLTWVAWKLLCKSDASMKNWCLGTEVRNARGLHDLVLKYRVKGTANGHIFDDIVNDRCMYRFVQIKHNCKSAQITYGSLTSKNKKNQYSLIYLYKSYIDMLGNFENITIDQVQDITIFTNANIDSDIKFLVPVNNDSIFGFEGKGQRYRIDNNILNEDPNLFIQLRKVKPNDLIIFDFLKKLMFAIDQPCESELENLIVKEMGRVYIVPQIFYNDLFNNILGWFFICNDGIAPYLTEKQLKQYLLNAENTLLHAKKSKTYIDKVSSLSDQLSRLRI